MQDTQQSPSSKNRICSIENKPSISEQHFAGLENVLINKVAEESYTTTSQMNMVYPVVHSYDTYAVVERLFGSTPDYAPRSQSCSNLNFSSTGNIVFCSSDDNRMKKASQQISEKKELPGNGKHGRPTEEKLMQMKEYLIEEVILNIQFAHLNLSCKVNHYDNHNVTHALSPSTQHFSTQETFHDSGANAPEFYEDL